MRVFRGSGTAAPEFVYQAGTLLTGDDMIRGWKPSVATIAGVMAGAVTFTTPASAHDARDTSNGVLINDWTGFTFYVDRPTTHKIAALMRDWNSTGQTLTEAGASASCLR